MALQKAEMTEAEYAKQFSPDVVKSVWFLIKSVLRLLVLFARTFHKHANLKNHLDDYAPRVSFNSVHVNFIVQLQTLLHSARQRNCCTSNLCLQGTFFTLFYVSLKDF